MEAKPSDSRDRSSLLWQVVAEGIKISGGCTRCWRGGKQSRMEERPAADSDHYRDMARKLRALAAEFRFPGARQEVLDLAARYERAEPPA